MLLIKKSVYVWRLIRNKCWKSFIKKVNYKFYDKLILSKHFLHSVSVCFNMPIVIYAFKQLAILLHIFSLPADSWMIRYGSRVFLRNRLGFSAYKDVCFFRQDESARDITFEMIVWRPKSRLISTVFFVLWLLQKGICYPGVVL